ncbi:hypothetical protein GGI25_004017 [Coemansia spiralis]|uniref:Arrestin C-terminal-like domain-containing protein n=2 Tax=Coemansia TaxID=4863 RepID=A0A9W8KX04_9FUNG|nr:hypothetical protein BX070DRAFT_254134 [Coemansia spiralis]KAJ1990098.1 hypothetical protein EDC05_004271 [Coemansia umbellata]KAJ2623814.1 hypothetical protein GGI26_002052 [Coemansia sp. RSA 1358]KAJ2675279.1 hypothetical protein GGI25_004017 [Coemansia spiralis]
MLSKGRLQVIPDSPDVFLYGSPRDARCAVITGRIIFTTKTPRPVCSLVARFRPKQEDMLNPAMSVACLSEVTCEVVRDGRIGETCTELPYNPATGQKMWRFTMGVPGNIGESVFTPSAFVAYEIVAELRTAAPLVSWTPFCRLTAYTPIAIKRVPSSDSVWSSVASEPMNVTAVWRNRVELTSISSSRVINDSQDIQISGVVRPLVKGMRLLRAGFELREFASGPFDSVGDNRTRGHTSVKCSHEIGFASSDTSYCQGGDVTIRMEFPATVIQRRAGIVIDQDIQITGCLKVPKAYEGVQYDIATGPIRVTHELAFAISIVDECGQVHNVRLSSVVYVFPLVSPALADLPRYEHSDKDILLAAGRRWSLESVAASSYAAPEYPWSPDHRFFEASLSPPPDYHINSTAIIAGNPAAAQAGSLEQ